MGVQHTTYCARLASTTYLGPTTVDFQFHRQDELMTQDKVDQQVCVCPPSNLPRGRLGVSCSPLCCFPLQEPLYWVESVHLSGKELAETLSESLQTMCL